MECHWWVLNAAQIPRSQLFTGVLWGLPGQPCFRVGQLSLFFLLMDLEINLPSSCLGRTQGIFSVPQKGLKYTYILKYILFESLIFGIVLPSEAPESSNFQHLFGDDYVNTQVLKLCWWFQNLF